MLQLTKLLVGANGPKGLAARRYSPLYNRVVFIWNDYKRRC